MRRERCLLWRGVLEGRRVSNPASIGIGSNLSLPRQKPGSGLANGLDGVPSQVADPNSIITMVHAKEMSERPVAPRPKAIPLARDGTGSCCADQPRCLFGRN